MILPVRLVRAAATDVADACAWYDARAPQAGRKFLAALERTFDHIASHPEIGRPSPAATRRVVLQRFPYLVFYRNTETAIVVIAVVHAAMDPHRLRRRFDH